MVAVAPAALGRRGLQRLRTKATRCLSSHGWHLPEGPPASLHPSLRSRMPRRCPRGWADEYFASESVTNDSVPLHFPPLFLEQDPRLVGCRGGGRAPDASPASLFVLPLCLTSALPSRVPEAGATAQSTLRSEKSSGLTRGPGTGRRPGALGTGIGSRARLGLQSESPARPAARSL